MTVDADRSWSLDLPKLNQSGAVELVSFARDTGICDLASAVDPELFLTLHIDHATVKALLQLITERSLSGDGVDAALQGIAEDLQQWLTFVGQ